MRVLRAFLRRTVCGDQALRESCSAGSREFIEPERNPSRSRVTNLKPRALKMRVNSAAISELRARRKFVVVDFDADDFAMVTHAELPEAERANCILALLDRAESLTRNRTSVFDARGQTSGSWLVPNPQVGVTR